MNPWNPSDYSRWRHPFDQILFLVLFWMCGEKLMQYCLILKLTKCIVKQQHPTDQQQVKG